MKKIISKIIASLLLLFIINIYISEEVFATNTIWDFSIPSDYTLSNGSTLIIENEFVKLQSNIIHKGSLVNGSGGANLNGATGIIVDGNYAYITASNSDALEIVDISNPNNPVHVSSLSNGGPVELDDPRGIVKDGNYLYIVSARSDALEIINVSDPYNPIHVSKIQDGGSTYLNGAIGIYKSGNYLYITSSSDDALEIIDVSNPNNPSHVGSLRDSNRLNGADGIFVQGNYAYVASNYDDSFQIINISNPSNPSFAGELTNGSGGAQLNGARSIVIEGNYAYVTASSSDALEIIDISNPNNPSHVSSISNGGLIKLDDPRGITKDGNFLYIVSARSDALEVINVSNPSFPIHKTSISNGWSTLLNGAMGVYKNGNNVFVSSYNSDALEIIEEGYDSTNPYVIPNNGKVYNGEIVSLTEFLGPNNQGSIKYQLSPNNGTTWYYYNGVSWISTLGGYSNSNTISELNNALSIFSTTFSTGTLKFKAFLHSDGTQNTELNGIVVNINPTIDSVDPSITFTYPQFIGVAPQGNFNIKISHSDDIDGGGIDTTSGIIEFYKWNGTSWGSDISGSKINLAGKTVSPFQSTYPAINISNGKYRIIFKISDLAGNQATSIRDFYVGEGQPTDFTNIIFHYDAQDINGNNNYSDEPANGTVIATISDKINGYNATQSNNNQRPTLVYNSINNHPSLDYDGVNDILLIADQPSINTGGPYQEKSFAVVFKTGNDVNTFQTIYEQGGPVRGYSFVIHNGEIWAGVWNNSEWDTGHQYKNVNMGVAQPNTIYFVMIVQDSKYGDDTLNVKKIYLNGNLTDIQLHVDQQYSNPDDIALGGVRVNTVRASDNLPINMTEGAYFSGNIGEMISWNYALSQADVNGIEKYFSDRWGISLFYEKYPVPSPTSSKNPSYTFVSNTAGTLTYGGSCSSTTTTAIVGDNTIILDSNGAGGEMPYGIYNDCTITLTSQGGFQSILNITPFEILNAPYQLIEITPVSTPTNDSTPNYTFYSPMNGVIEYYGGCYSDMTTAFIGNNTVTFNYLADGSYTNCYIKVSNNINVTPYLLVTPFTINTGGNEPTYVSGDIFDNKLFPIGNFDFDFNYIQTAGGGINTSSQNIQLYKWNGAAWGSNIASSYVVNNSTTTTTANYTMTNAPFGKYKIIFEISSTGGATLSKEFIFYIDKVELLISTGSLDLGTLSNGITKFSIEEFSITVKTVGAGFDVILNKELSLNYFGAQIIDWNGIDGFGYDTSPYTSLIKLINTNEIIATEAPNLNINGDRNTYIYGVKLGALITPEQAAGNYTGNIRFGIKFDY